MNRRPSFLVALLVVAGLNTVSGAADADPASLGRFGSSSARPPRTDWKETVVPGEEEVFRDFAREINTIQDRTALESGMPLDRAFHPKQHAVMTAQFRVIDSIPEAYRLGAFKQPGIYSAWVRFSNLIPRRQEDRKADFRAIAVKILGVPGTPLTSGVTTLDLMALNHSIQPARDIHQFIAFVRYSANILTFPVKLAKAIGVIEAARMLKFMATNLGGRKTSLAAQNYWSTLPIAYGKYAAKYRFVPKNGDGNVVNSSSPDYLRWELTDRLKKGPLHWDVMVQFYTDPLQTPIEDAVDGWDPAQSPFLKVGELTITARDLTTPQAQAEEVKGNKMLFNPWHAPVEHRPLGNLQRARRVAYPASGRHRDCTPPAKN